MSRLRRFFACLLTVLLMTGLFVPPASAAELYFTSINDHLTPLTADTMPIWSAGVLYVPYTVFNTSTNGSNDLGVACSYNRSSNTLALFNLRQMLSFDLTTGDCINEVTQEPHMAKAIMRNNIPYLSLARVCDFFGLDHSYCSIPYIPQAYLVRIKDDQVALSDYRFIDAASNLVNRYLKEYNQSISAPSSPAAPTDPVTPEAPVPDNSVTPTYLAIRADSSDGLTDILDRLDSLDVCLLFLLTPDAMEGEGDLIRRILGSGHSLGFWSDGQDTESTRAQLARGAELLDAAAHSRTTIARVPKSQREALSAEGWVCWNSSVTLSPGDTVGGSTFASTALSKLEGHSGDAFLTLSGGKNTARVLPTLIRRLTEENYTIHIPLETRL